ncbi:MAG: hypothetical protein KDI13_01500 [Alphaproteobacteria bacterium]|nr:hypothetical protein [Alphaproteobacteria bacterium]
MTEASAREAKVRKEYDDFAYIVSHDLSASLRHIKTFTRLLIAEHQETLSDEEKEYVYFLEQGLHNLEEMQNALLIFSRLNTRAAPLEPCDCNEIARNALKKLSGVIQKTDPIINTADLPTVMADAGQLSTLFYNILENALKFRAEDGPAPEITIDSQKIGSAWQFTITDNGIGIEEAFLGDVFRMFRRLHPNTYPGIGAGLTICKKIVERHDGKIHLEPAKDKGISVIFTLPA